MNRLPFAYRALPGLLLGLTAGAVIADEASETIAEAIPGTRISSTSPTVIDGLYEVVAGKNVLYVDKTGRYLWPGFGQNLRVLQWIIGRCRGEADAVDTAIGYLPAAGSISSDGLSMRDGDMDTLLTVDKRSWSNEMRSFSEYLEQYGDRVPDELHRQLHDVTARLGEE